MSVIARSTTSAARIADDGGRDTLLANGVTQSVAPRDALAWGSYWAAMVPPFAFATRRWKRATTWWRTLAWTALVHPLPKQADLLGRPRAVTRH
jgi:hypothetical protein